MNIPEKHILRSIKQLAQKECANYFNGVCIPTDKQCHVVNPAYQTAHYGVADCDYFHSTVLPLQPELNTAVLHEILREEGQVGEGWKNVSAVISRLSLPAIANSSVPTAEQQQNRSEAGRNSVAIVQEKDIPVALPYRTKVQGN